MNIEPISRPIDTRRGVSGTTPGPAPPPPPHLPDISPVAMPLAAPLLSSDPAIVKRGLEAIRLRPSSAGVEALAFVAAVAREAARTQDGDAGEWLREYAGSTQQLSELVAQLVDAESAALKASVHRELGRFWKEAFTAGYDRGVVNKAQEISEDERRPVLRRETKFISDDRGRITGKSELEYRAGGKS